MGLTLLVIAFCLAFGVIAGIASSSPGFIRRTLPALGAGIRSAEVKRFSPKRTLFLFGPFASHPACRLQRRLLKPAIPAFIREDVTVIEVYGDERPRKNGEAIDWLDAALLRHAMDAENGFALIFCDEDGKTSLRSDTPMVTADILYRTGLPIPVTLRSRPAASAQRNAVLKKLRAA